MGKWMLGTMFWASTGIAQVGSLVEVAPLHAAMGQVAVHGEVAWRHAFAWGGGYQRVKQPGQREGVSDLSQRVIIDGAYYPSVWKLAGFSLNAGLSYERTDLNRERERNYVSQISYTADERMQYWVNHRDSLSSSIGVGYRLDIGSLFTTAFRCFYDSPLYSHSRDEELVVYDRDIDLAAPRATPRTSFIFYVGLKLPTKI